MAHVAILRPYGGSQSPERAKAQNVAAQKEEEPHATFTACSDPCAQVVERSVHRRVRPSGGNAQRDSRRNAYRRANPAANGNRD